MTFKSKGVTTTLLGTCPYGSKGILTKNVNRISAHFSIERVSFVESVQKTMLS